MVDEARATAPAGVYVEPKGLTVTLHWRRAPVHKDWVLAFVERQHAEHGLVVHEGRHERELRPPVEVDKGTVVHALVAEHDARAEPLRAAAAFGDDIGDLPAFAALDDLRTRRRRAAHHGARRRRRHREPGRGCRRRRPHGARRHRGRGAAPSAGHAPTGGRLAQS